MRPVTILLFASLAVRAQTPADIEYFDKEIKPLLRANCQGCHSANVLNSGLALDSRDAMTKGGNRGPAAKAGDGNSLLLRAVRQEGELKMPPGRKLTAEQISKLEKWVSLGLPADDGFIAAKRRKSAHWAFQPVAKPAVPAVKAAGGARNPIDNFRLAKLRE